MRFFDNIQRSFYSNYFGEHAMKLKSFNLPNGMCGSFYIGPMCVSDAGLMSMNGLDTYFFQLFRQFSMHMCGTSNLLSAIYRDRTFPQLWTVVAIYSTSDKNEDRLNTRLASIRQSIGHILYFHKNKFTLFSIPDRFRLLISGVESSRLIYNSFFC